MRRDQRLKEFMQPGQWYLNSELANALNMTTSEVGTALRMMLIYDEVEKTEVIVRGKPHNAWRLKQ